MKLTTLDLNRNYILIRISIAETGNTYFLFRITHEPGLIAWTNGGWGSVIGHGNIDCSRTCRATIIYTLKSR